MSNWIDVEDIVEVKVEGKWVKGRVISESRHQESGEPTFEKDEDKNFVLDDDGNKIKTWEPGWLEIADVDLSNGDRVTIKPDGSDWRKV